MTLFLAFSGFGVCCRLFSFQLHYFFTAEFISPDLPMINSVNYRDCGCLQDSVVRDVDELKQRFVNVWSDFGQVFTDESRKRLQACIRAKGRHFEHSSQAAR